MDLSPNFTPHSQKIIKQAKTLAKNLGYQSVQSYHLLLILLKSDCDNILDFLSSIGIEQDELVKFITDYYDINKQSSPPDTEPEYSPELKDFLKVTHEFALQLGDDYVGSDHLFFCFLNLKEGVICSFLSMNNINVQQSVRGFLLKIQTNSLFLKNDIDFNELNSKPGMPPTQNESMLESFAVNLNSECRHNKISPIIGKDLEISRLCEILARKNKSNPMLLGDPGVGKTAVVEGLALKIIKSDVPEFLLNKEIYAIDLASMIAGTKYRGQFEQRIKSLINECQDKPEVILFIDEAHTLVGAGSAEGAMDAANILKPALARGKIKLIAATTFSEYKKNFEKDTALVRRFENVFIDEPNCFECFDILKGLKSHYEEFHQVKYNHKILKQIIELSDIYLPGDKFPDKAIDVMDELGAMLKIINSTPPAELKSVENNLYDCFHGNNCSEESEEALLQKYEKLSDDWKKMPREVINSRHVYQIISRKSKIPIDHLIKSHNQTANNLSKLLLKNVINQDSAVLGISKSIMRSQIGLKDKHKPIGSFLFLGSSGVGKTWTAKQLAYHYFGSYKNIIRFDMSEYSDKISVSKLIGASPGYVGYEEGGLLTEKIKRLPHSVVLFDEIEKAHSTVQQLLLQIMEEGELQDNNGVKFYFNECLIILTSNIGSDLTTKSSLGFSPMPTNNREKIFDSAKKILSPELINRLDDVIVFNHLDDQNLFKIFESEIKSIQKKLKSKKIKINYSNDVGTHICILAAKEKMGARPLKRLIKHYIEDKIVDFYFKNLLTKGIVFNFFMSNDEVACEILE